MASLNKAQIIGYLGRDPEMRYMPDGAAVANVSIATTSVWKDKQSGEKKEDTEWHRVAAFGRLAEVMGEYLKKGSQVYVEGRLQTRKWQDKETGQDRYTTQIIADSLVMLGGKDSGSRSEPPPTGSREKPKAQAKPEAAKPAGGGAFDDMEDDIPF